jgi:hypothetical protein
MKSRGIRHANVAAVLDVEEHAGEVSLMMEYVEGARWKP